MRAPRAERTDLPGRLRAQGAQCEQAGSPLTAALLAGAADDYDAHGPTRRLLEPLAADPPGSVPALRFAGALHRLVLERRAPQLALYYPSVGGTAAADQVWPVGRQAVEDHHDELVAALRRPVQTNEVGRSAVLLGGLLQVAAQTELPVRLLELGASAGLNLLVDRFAYEVAPGWVLGDPASPVRLHRPWQGQFPPPASLQIAERAGCDPAPLDPASAADRLTLTSYVWADQVHRFERLRAALSVAATGPVAVEPLAASGFLDRRLRAPAEGTATVVWHSVVRQYLAPAERIEVDRVLADAGARATPTAPLFRLSLEPERIGAASYRLVLELTSWPTGQRRTLASCQGHGPPVVWT